MPRTTKEQVVEVLGAHYDGSTVLTPFIDSAYSLVNKVESNDVDVLLQAFDLELIERWLAGHFYAHHDQLMQNEGTGRANATYQGQTAMIFQSTQYGQAALGLDVTGYLAELQQQALEGKRKAKVIWGGTRYKDDESERSSDQ